MDYLTYITLGITILLVTISWRRTKRLHFIRSFRETFDMRTRHHERTALGKSLFHHDVRAYSYVTDLGFDEAFQEIWRLLLSCEVLDLSSDEHGEVSVSFHGRFNDQRIRFTFWTTDTEPYGPGEKQVFFSAR